ncbi:MAG: type 1 glutamine amidotransferase [Chromatiales bacterium]|nr:type 1 glutamine amidotransferase [Chromatiales bacterium]
MRIIYTQHVPFEDLGAMAPWFRARGIEPGAVRLDLGQALPESDSFDALIVMGGPMGVNDNDQYQWLEPERELIRSAIRNGRHVLGVCLGAQQIAAAMGARVYRNAEREIGWFDITSTPQAGSHPLGRALPARDAVFHWHGDTFDLPNDAVWLARSDACAHQAFALGDRVLALQFHLETTVESATALTVNCADEMVPAKYVQSTAQVLSDPQRFEVLNRHMAALLEAWIAA